MRRIFTLAIVTALVLAACGDSTPGTTASPGTSPPATAGAVAGEFTKTVERTGHNGLEVFTGEDINEDGVIDTDSSGQADFDITRGSTDCSMGSASQAIAAPAGQASVVLKVQTAPTLTPIVCAVGSKGDVEFDAGEQVRVVALDPILSIALDEDRALVKSLYGFIGVESLATGEVVLVGPNRQVTVPIGEGPGPVVRIEINDFEAERLPRLLDVVPTVEPQDVDFSESSTLTTAFDNGEWLIFVDSEPIREAGLEDFLFRLEAFLGERLAIDVVFELVDPETLVDAANTGQAAALSPRSLAGTVSAGLFTDNAAAVWAISVTADDPAFADVWRDVLSIVLLDTAFDDLHSGFFDIPLDYEAVFAARG